MPITSYLDYFDCKVKPLTFNKNVDPAVNKNYKILTRVLQKLPQSNMQRIEKLEHPLNWTWLASCLNDSTYMYIYQLFFNDLYQTNLGESKSV